MPAGLKEALTTFPKHVMREAALLSHLYLVLCRRAVRGARGALSRCTHAAQLWL